MSQPVKLTHIILIPTTPAAVPNASLFLDSSNANQFTLKDTIGNVNPVGGGGAASLIIKSMIAGEAFGVNQALSKRPDGKVIKADSDDTDAQNLIGYALSASGGNNAPVNVLLVGANLAGAITGLGFTPGQEIFVDENGGYTNDVSTFAGRNDSIIKVGIADCAASTASGTAVDLVAFPQVVMRP